MADTIQAVIDDLTAILDECATKQSRLGYFAALYRRVTIRVQEGIAAGRFEDGPRMERLDVVFARRYIDAYRAAEAGLPYCPCWQKAFAVAVEEKPLVLQQLLVGMNVHINLDLGIAAAAISTPATLPALERDFTTINQLLAKEMPKVRTILTGMSPLLWVLDWVGGERDTALINFSMNMARQAAWQFAISLVGKGDVSRPEAIAAQYPLINELTRRVASPGGFLQQALGVIKWFESKDVSATLARLRAD